MNLDRLDHRTPHQWRGALDRQSEEYRDLLVSSAAPSVMGGEGGER
jgi:hypothetical protein